jgi:hypothetical protein
MPARRSDLITRSRIRNNLSWQRNNRGAHAHRGFFYYYFIINFIIITSSIGRSIARRSLSAFKLIVPIAELIAK